MTLARYIVRSSWVFLACLFVVVPMAIAGGDWNDDGIAWRPLKEGRAEAREQGKPLCLVIYTDWCPHCTNYSRVFHDAEIEKLSKNFVMVRLNQDSAKAAAAQYVPDGAYVPRTLFLDSQGKVDESIQAPRSKYIYFYDEHNPAQLRQAMKQAVQKLRPLSEAS